jgi:hypothetical protein
MRQLLALGLTALLPLVVAGGAGGSGTQFAVGSAKSGTELTLDLEHASFSAHSTGDGCEATGHIVYTADEFDFTAKITMLVISGSRAFFAGPITNDRRGGQEGNYAVFNAFDSGLAGGTGDGFLFASISPVEPGCFVEPVTGHPITSGNIVIKATGPMLLP